MRRPIILAHNIISSLGLTSEENYEAVKAYRSGIKVCPKNWLSPKPFAASLIDQNHIQFAGNLTLFELLAINSIADAYDRCDFRISADDTLFIISTTKGNVDMLRDNKTHAKEERVKLAHAAKIIQGILGNHNSPIVVSNACISGLNALILGDRFSRMGYKHIIICGLETLSPFIMSGFQSLMAVSDEPCRPFDDERRGINLGEAAATIILEYRGESRIRKRDWVIEASAIRNDAYHNTNPSPTAEGSYLCLKKVMENFDPHDLAFINAHGTASLFNDEMEAKAIERAGLIDVPVNSYKGYFGHTMGAAGLVESIISMMAVDDHTIIGTKGFKELGVSKPIDVVGKHRHTDKKAFVKLISGFGGTNAAVLFRKFK